MGSQTKARSFKKLAGKQKRRLVAVYRKVRKKTYRLLMAPLRSMPGGPSAIMCMLAEKEQFTPEQVILNYSQGLFPIGTESRIKWDDPQDRAILPLDKLHVEKELGRIIRQGRFEITFDKNFRDVMIGCSERDDSWITPQIMEVYEQLHQWGAAHSVEAWQNEKLVGGAYGVALGGVFVGESMFYRVRNASKVALVHLAERLKQGGFKFMDCQYPSKHWMRFGAIQITCTEYKKRLAKALTESSTFHPLPQQESTDD
jgi:leucyl/phenylalanyl-tRNA--protein transferase